MLSPPNQLSPLFLHVLLLLFFGTLVIPSWGEVYLEHLSTVYLPFSYLPCPKYNYNKDVAEQSAYDSERKVLYTVGNDILHVIDVSDVKNPHVIFYDLFSRGELTDIETCGGFVAVAFDNKVNPLEGKVIVLQGYNKTTHSMGQVHSITVGAVPDMLTFTADCQKIVVAIEGELRMVNGQVVDPEGGVGIISFQGNKTTPYGTASLKVANFTKFNDVADRYMCQGVRWVYHGEGAGIQTTFSQDLEPEFVALNKKETKAFVTLQENNAIAEVDIMEGEVVEIHALGHKSWKKYETDTSDKDGGIKLISWPIYGIYQPDSLKYVPIGGHGYILTANEGEEKEYEMPEFPFEFTDGRSGRSLVEEGLLDLSVSEQLQQALSDDTKLGRLTFSTIDGIDPLSRKIKELHTYGARSFSLWDSTDFSLVFDSGDDIEQKIAKHLPQVFNSDGKKGGPEISMDSRSRKKGPEPETLAFGRVNNKTILFIGNERPGIILLYSISDDDPNNPHFESAHYAGGSGATWEDLYRQKRARDIDPEDIRFLEPSISPNGEPLLVVSSATSGTVALYKVVNRKMEDSSEVTGTTDL